jgi:cytochrome c6
MKIVLTAWLVWAIAVAPVWAATPAQLFEIHCAGCHPKGGNIIRRGKTLKQQALQKNGYGTVETIAQIIRQGKGNMSAFKDRLTEAEIGDLAEYVKAQAANQWR